MKTKIFYSIFLSLALNTFAQQGPELTPGAIGDAEILVNRVSKTNVVTKIYSSYHATYKGYWATYVSVGISGPKSEANRVLKEITEKQAIQVYGHKVKILSLETNDFSSHRNYHVIFRIGPTTVADDGKIILVK